MPNGPRLVLANACYHITTRGNQRQRIFHDEEDFKKYLATIKRVKRSLAFRLYGYCLMPNHVHLVGEPGDPRNLAKFMQRINRSYTAYFNWKYKKVGHLWQGRFKSKVIIKDRYLIDCINYIELNPVRAAMVCAPQEYRWSSYKERNLGVDKERQILDNLNL